MNKSVVCIGTVILDCIVRGFDPVPVSETGFHAGSTALFPGGEALNQAVTLAKLGMEPRIVCGTGEDGASVLLLSELEKYHVDTRFILHPEGMSTPVTVMFVDEKGGRKSVTNDAHHLNIRPDLDLSYLEGAAAVSLGSLFRAPFDDPEIIYKVVSAAKEKGLPVFADTKLPNFRKLSLSDLADSLPLLDFITPNEPEARYFSGKENPEDCADVFLSFGVKNVIIKLGAEGCLLKNKDLCLRLPAEDVNAVDATGAGDNFLGGLITATLLQYDLPKALRFANICGGICSTMPGATTALLDRDQVLSRM